jgi:uncharacterized membrane protein
MFELLFKYPPAAFTKGELVWLAPWPFAWAAAGLLLAAALLAGQIGRQAQRLTRPRRLALWLLQAAFLALLLLVVRQPALSVTTLKPRQNIVAVLLDDSRSMAVREAEGLRIEQARAVLRNGLLDSLGARFQVRLYRFGDRLTRIEKPEEAAGQAQATHIGQALSALAAEAAGLPLGAVVLLSDGADTRGGVGREVIEQLRARRLPVHTLGFGRERFERDVEMGRIELPARALPGDRLTALVAVRQNGYRGARVRLAVREGGKTLASREIRLAGPEQTEWLSFAAGAAGPHRLEFLLEPLAGEENARNNALARLLQVEDLKPRLLYMEGEPRWEFKFIRRAVEEDPALRLVTLLRTTENKLYRQGIADPKELEQGFPASAEELFAFRGLILGSLESGYFTAAQQELIRQFADRRGGGVLWLGGRRALAEGGWSRPPLADPLPAILPAGKQTFHRDRARVRLTPAGADSLICRLEESPEANLERWRKLPALADYQEAGEPKPGAVVLAELDTPEGRRLPLLVTQNYGRGRTALFATGGSWRWQMLQEPADQSHEIFWRQLLRWLVNGAPGQVSGSTPAPVLEDDSRAMLRAEVRDKAFLPLADARVEARILGPEGLSETVELRPQAGEPGLFQAEWTAGRPGAYSAEIAARRGEQEIGRDLVLFRREDGVAEDFRAEQNRELLRALAEQTGGRYWRPAEADRLAREISYSEAGIGVRETLELWDMPFVFLLALALRSSEWLLRRAWGAV